MTTKKKKTTKQQAIQEEQRRVFGGAQRRLEEERRRCKEQYDRDEQYRLTLQQEYGWPEALTWAATRPDPDLRYYTFALIDGIGLVTFAGASPNARKTWVTLTTVVRVSSSLDLLPSDITVPLNRIIYVAEVGSDTIRIGDQLIFRDATEEPAADEEITAEEWVRLHIGRVVEGDDDGGEISVECSGGAIRTIAYRDIYGVIPNWVVQQ